MIDKFGNPFKDIKSTFLNVNPSANVTENLDLEGDETNQVITSRPQDRQADSFTRADSNSNLIFSSVKKNINYNENSTRVRPPQPLDLSSVSESEIGGNIHVDISTFNSDLENDSLALVNFANQNYDSEQALGKDNQSIFLNNNKILAAI